MAVHCSNQSRNTKNEKPEYIRPDPCIIKFRNQVYIINSDQDDAHLNGGHFYCFNSITLAPKHKYDQREYLL